MKAHRGNRVTTPDWFTHVNALEEDIFQDLEEQSGDGIVFLEEAHEALSRLSQKTNKRGRLMKQPRRAEQWD